MPPCEPSKRGDTRRRIEPIRRRLSSYTAKRELPHSKSGIMTGTFVTHDFRELSARNRCRLRHAIRTDARLLSSYTDRG